MEIRRFRGVAMTGKGRGSMKRGVALKGMMFV